MKNQTSPKNLILGFALGVIVTATLGAALKRNSDVGRFQVSAGGNNAHVVDTVTGQVWTLSNHRQSFTNPKASDPSF